VVTLAEWLSVRLPFSNVVVILGAGGWKLESSGTLRVEKLLPGQAIEQRLAVATIPRPGAVVIDGALIAEADGTGALRSFFDQAAVPTYVLFRDSTALSSVLPTWAGEPLVGVAPIHPGVVANALAAAGLESSPVRPGWTAHTPQGGLSSELTNFLTQVRPQSVEEYALVRVTASSVAAEAPHAEGVSVLVWARTSLAEELDGAMFSLVYQDEPPLQVLLCLGQAEAQIPERAWGEEAAAAGIALVRVEVPDASGEAAVLNAGLDRARGRFLAFLAGNAVALPSHLARLRAALVAGEQACVLANAQEALVRRSAGSYIESKRPLGGWSARGWPRFDETLPSRLMVDRSRVAPFHLRFRDGGEAWRDSLLPALFGASEPLELDGTPSVEVRVDVESGPNLAVEDSTNSLVRLLRRPASQLAWRPSVLLRHRAADALSAAVKSMMPGLHRRLRRLIAGRLEGR
jgi:hypothetical protein